MYCGLDLHARTLYVCMLPQDGAIIGRRPMPASPESLLKTLAPSREQMVIAVACLCTWYWLADLGAREGMPCVRGHALSLKTIHGGKATNERMDAQNIAVLLRGGLRPQADGSLAAMRATRALLRRRRPLRRTRAAWRTHSQKTHRQ